MELPRPARDGTATCARALLLAALRGEELPGPALTVLAGPDAGRRIPVYPGIVGRGRSADVALADPTLSRHHLRLVVEGDRVLVEDLGSRNGSRIDGGPVRGLQPLAPGSVLAIGRSRLRLTGDDDGGAGDGARPGSRTLGRLLLAASVLLAAAGVAALLA